MGFNIRVFAKENIFVLIILLLAILAFHQLLSPSRIMSNVHYINDVTFYSYNLKKSLSEGSLPLWTPYYYSGRPIFSQPEYHFIDLNFILIALTGNINFAMNYSVIFYFFLAGFGMFILCSYLLKDKQASFIATFLYMFNSFVHSFVVPGNIMVLEGYSLIPLFLLFLIKAFREHEYILDSIIAGIFLALLVFSGGIIFFPYLFVLVAVFAAVYLPGENFKRRLVKYTICSAIILALGLGLSAVKLLPGIEFMKLSNRSDGIPYHEYLGEPIKLKSFGYAFISSVFLGEGGISSALGIIGFLLVIFGLYKLKSKAAIFSLVVILISLFLSTESFVTKFLFNVPIFNQARHIERAIFLFAFAGSVLAALGFISARSYAARHKIKSTILLAVILVLMASELYFMLEFPGTVKVVSPSDIPILERMSQDNSLFRTVNEAMSTLIGASGYNYYAQKGISEAKGGGGIWFNDYMEFLIVANDIRPKFWGVLNVKYVVENENITLAGLDFVEKFEECLKCNIWEAYGPYLYRNNYSVPRFYFIGKAILVSGEDAKASGIVYGLMSRDEWDPKDSVIIRAQKPGSLGFDALSKMDSVIIFSNPDDNDESVLRSYVSGGKKVFPDIFSGKNSISEDDFKLIFQKGAQIEEPVLKSYENNKVVLEVDGKEGWLVVSERFAYFPGWRAFLDGSQIRIFSADNAISAVYVKKGAKELVFEYYPDSYRKGKIISAASLIILVIYFGYRFKRKKVHVHG